MKYGETLFIIVYLLIDAYCGTAVLRFARNKAENLMGYAILILGIGDAFHLIPRIIDHFSETDVSFYLGSGKLITSVTMTIFYVILYIILRILTKAEKNKKLDTAVISLCALRIAVCLFRRTAGFSTGAICSGERFATSRSPCSADSSRICISKSVKTSDAPLLRGCS